MGRAMVDLYCGKSYSKAPERIVLDIDDTFDAVHGGQQLRLFNAHYDEYGFQPDRRVRWRGPFHHCCAAPGQTPRRQGDQGLSAPPAARHSRQLASGRDSGARRRPLYALPEVLDFLSRANRLDYILGVALTSTLRRHIEGLEAATKTQYETTPGNGEARRFKEFYDGAASSSVASKRVIARVEVGAQGPDTRFVVTNLQQRNARRLYEEYTAGAAKAENHIKSWKTPPPGGRPHVMHQGQRQPAAAVPAAPAPTGSMWGLRMSMPKHSMWRVAQFDTLRLRLISKLPHASSR